MNTDTYFLSISEEHPSIWDGTFVRIQDFFIGLPPIEGDIVDLVCVKAENGLVGFKLCVREPLATNEE